MDNNSEPRKISIDLPNVQFQPYQFVFEGLQLNQEGREVMSALFSSTPNLIELFNLIRPKYKKCDPNENKCLEIECDVAFAIGDTIISYTQTYVPPVIHDCDAKDQHIFEFSEKIRQLFEKAFEKEFRQINMAKVWSPVYLVKNHRLSLYIFFNSLPSLLKMIYESGKSAAENIHLMNDRFDYSFSSYIRYISLERRDEYRNEIQNLKNLLCELIDQDIDERNDLPENKKILLRCSAAYFVFNDQRKEAFQNGFREVFRKFDL